MLITGLLPMLQRYSLALDLVAGPDDTVTMTAIPRKSVGSSKALEGAEIRPISITGTAAEIDAELAKGADGALGQLIAARAGLADQIAEQLKAADAAKTAAKPKPAAAAPKATTPAPKPADPPSAPAVPGEPASLW